ncbi:ABC transporter ATP-binding protein [Pseudoalteromonas luteoviolacea]|uniref:ABC transporter ATP-binding protein n=1 Tax=Pseudoalteromonas luteoviolacea TaxID=43657 RepID=UPI001B37D293|nr:ABC transporter ATP-binding protein [Pseudoalteromonas luteoviolacea]MBQ4813305.1 ABC transporter ATP-binding protein [Pseudoalteromonas luteoviolacea]
MDWAVNVEQVNFSYFDNAVIKDLSCQLKPNKVYSLLGENGAGKTTLIKLLLGRLAPLSGRISVLGHQPGSQAAKNSIGAMLQVGTLPSNIRVVEYIQLFQSYYDSPMCWQGALQFAELEAQQNTFFGQLSGGEKQRLLLSLALIGQPKLVVLDEPTLAMDVYMRQRIWEKVVQLKAQGTTVILTTHNLQEVESVTDQVLVLRAGEIVAQGTPSQLKSNLQRSELRFASDTSEATIKSLLPNYAVHTEGQKIYIATDDAPDVISLLRQHKVTMYDLSVTPLSLAQAFMDITRGGE